MCCTPAGNFGRPEDVLKTAEIERLKEQQAERDGCGFLLHLKEEVSAEIVMKGRGLSLADDIPE